MNRFLLWASLVMLSSCVGTETGNPDVAQMHLRVVSTEPERLAVVMAGAGATPAELEVTSATLGLQEVRFVQCGGGEEIVQNLILELAGGSETVPVPSGEYCSISLRLGPMEGDADSAALQVAGRRVSDGAATVISLVDERAASLTTQDRGPVVLTADSSVVLTVDLAQLIAVEALDRLAAVDGEVVVSESRNQEAARTFSEQLPFTFLLVRDPEADGQVSAEDLADPLMVP